jgi:hypothetical protein
MGIMNGATLGTADGLMDGEWEGLSVGRGVIVGINEGDSDGLDVLGDADGKGLGSFEGLKVNKKGSVSSNLASAKETSSGTRL